MPTPQPYHYAPASKGIPIPPSLIKWLATFYALSDDSSAAANSTYVGLFHANARFVIGSNRAEGTAAIRTAREKMWDKVSGRKHEVLGIAALGDGHGLLDDEENGVETKTETGTGTVEVLLHGVVTYTLRANGALLVGLPWAGRAVVAPVVGEGGGEGWEFREYQVYMDSAPLSNAIAAAEKTQE